MSIVKKLFASFRSLSVAAKITTGVLSGVIVVVLVHAATTSPTTPTPQTFTHVTLASVASLANGDTALPVTGTVTSLSKASILAQSSGEVIGLSHELGDVVAAGTVIAYLENSSQEATVLQAQGAYAAAQAALTKAKGSTAPNSGVTSAQAQTAADNAKTAAEAALQSAAATLDDAVHTKTDAFFTNPRTASAQFTLLVPDSVLVNTITTTRVSLEATLAETQTLASASNSTALDDRITNMIADAQTILAYLTNVVDATNKAVPTSDMPASTIAADQTTATAARTEVLTAITTLTTAKSSYDAAVSGATTAATSASTGTDSDIAAAEANVQSALGTLDAAKAALEKTIVRSPISGTIVSLPITKGQYVSALSTVAQVSNPHALEIDAYVTAADAKTLAVGDTATVDGGVEGTIVFIAPALDPSTGKVEVKIGLPANENTLTDGDTVRVNLSRSEHGSTTATTTAMTLTIPIIAAKITPTGPVVFTVSSSTLQAQPITFGPILGDSVTVTAGLTADMDIVTDARGLADGQAVVVDAGN